MENILDVDHLSVRFGDTAVLRDLSFGLAKGATLAVIGPNGSGKTVLFRALIGALPHDGVLRWAPGTRFGYVPQKLDIDRDLPLTGLDLLSARAGIAGVGAKEVAAALGRVGLEGAVASRPIGALSGGQFQLLLVAFALLANPNVLLLDEPTAGIDEPGQDRLHEVLRSLRAERDTTVLLISHELSVVYRYATNVLCLSREEPCFGPPEEMLTPERIEQVYGTPLRYHRHR